MLTDDCCCSRYQTETWSPSIALALQSLPLPSSAKRQSAPTTPSLRQQQSSSILLSSPSSIRSRSEAKAKQAKLQLQAKATILDNLRHCYNLLPVRIYHPSSIERSAESPTNPCPALRAVLHRAAPLHHNHSSAPTRVSSALPPVARAIIAVLRRISSTKHSPTLRFQNLGPNSSRIPGPESEAP